MKTTSTVMPSQYISTACEPKHALTIHGEGTEQECLIMQSLFSRGFDLAVKEMNGEIEIKELAKSK